MRWRSTIAMKSRGVYRSRAERAKCGLPEIKLLGPTSRLVKLQRPPPEIRIFSASFGA
jgi:hypothetical protein